VEKKKRNELEKSAYFSPFLSCLQLWIIALHRALLNDTLDENIIRQHVTLMLFIVANNKKRKILCNKNQILLIVPDIISDIIVI
jgi:hypothetical protein